MSYSSECVKRLIKLHVKTQTIAQIFFLQPIKNKYSLIKPQGVSTVSGKISFLFCLSILL